ncbi:GntR family transcriptional regulator [Streptomyces roseoverticillatus]|uniref:GntR family transcriptional regulator n=1 Tax=Streptomyces roseoverticillatus TaxID=66429 RepID=UPI001F227BC8|nr:GntR family transcriptional regulator [Streptomyces roseoverticillatus]MCF3102933.1 GntR family transcriptional regulator [Streptomyces roseoverticillatus]
MREQPPYLRTADLLRQRIANREWAPGDRLPSRAQLAQECGVGEAVVRRAQETLISEGFLEGRAGSGTYVAEPRERVRIVRSPEREQAGAAPFIADMAELGKKATWECRSDAMVPAPPDIATRLGIPEGDYCVRSSYEYLADGKPVLLSTSWEPYAVTSGTLAVLPEGGPFAGMGVVRRMAEIGITVSRAVERPRPGQASAEEANLLGIQRGTSVTRIQRTYYSDEGRPVETADLVVPDALCEIAYEVPISS